MRVGVYAISKNEGKHVRPWLEACGEASAWQATEGWLKRLTEE